jgi:hypothetical protein
VRVYDAPPGISIFAIKKLLKTSRTFSLSIHADAFKEIIKLKNVSNIDYKNDTFITQPDHSYHQR